MREYLHLRHTYFEQYGGARTPLVILIQFFMCCTKNWPHFVVKHWIMTSQEIERLRSDINASYCNLQQQFAYNRLCFLVISNARHFNIVLLINLKLNDEIHDLRVMTIKCILHKCIVSCFWDVHLTYNVSSYISDEKLCFVRHF